MVTKGREGEGGGGAQTLEKITRQRKRDRDEDVGRQRKEPEENSDFILIVGHFIRPPSPSKAILERVQHGIHSLLRCDAQRKYDRLRVTITISLCTLCQSFRQPTVVFGKGIPEWGERIQNCKCSNTRLRP